MTPTTSLFVRVLVVEGKYRGLAGTVVDFLGDDAALVEFDSFPLVAFKWSQLEPEEGSDAKA